jgi:hypothetical protein
VSLMVGVGRSGSDLDGLSSSYLAARVLILSRSPTGPPVLVTRANFAGSSRGRGRVEMVIWSFVRVVVTRLRGCDHKISRSIDACLIDQSCSPGVDGWWAFSGAER